MRPPAAGMHGRHRVLGTPGPTGWNDHGDPCHARRGGPTPGSLGVNDHGTPLPEPAALLLAERRQDAEAHINQIIEAAGSAQAQTEHQLQACLDAVKNQGNADQSQGEVARCAEAYFQARLHAVQGKNADTGGNRERAEYAVGGVEYRAPGTFFQPLGSQQSAAAQRGLSYQRIGQALPGRSAGLAAPDSAAEWIEKGTKDGLRDRSDGPGKLRRHVPIT